MCAGKQPGEKHNQDGSINTSGSTAEKPHLCVYPEEGGSFKTKHTLSMFSQCQHCNIFTLIMEMHWGFSSSLKRGILRQSCTTDKHQAYLQIKFWHICLYLQMSGGGVSILWMKCMRSTELIHPHLWIQVSPGTLTWGGQEMSNFLTSCGGREGHLFIKVVDLCQLKEKEILAVE